METTATNDIIIEILGVSKAFPGVKALDGVDLQIRRGKLTALIGENGAGKSTLMNILAGVFPPDEGQLFFAGRPISFADTRHAQKCGIAIVFQELNLFPYLSIAENVFLGREPLTVLGLVDYPKMNRNAAALLDRLGIEFDPRSLMAELRVGQRQMVEIAKALSFNPDVIIMDEPTSALSEHEIETLFGLIWGLKHQGVGIVYITHKLDELFEIGDYVTVLRDGKLIESGELRNYSRGDLVRFMVGRDLGSFHKVSPDIVVKEVFRIEQATLRSPSRPDELLLNDVTFSLGSGEVLGIFGLIGAGRTELLETIFGLHPGTSTAAIFVNGKQAKILTPSDAIATGIGFVTEDRRHEGIVPQMGVCPNASLASLDKAERFLFVSDRLEKAYVNDYLGRFRVKATSMRQPIKDLSGGNQQKVILAKWLATKPKILLLDEPTRGIDIHAKREIYDFIVELAESGLGVVLVSSEMPEILALSDRIIVMCEGRKTAEFIRGEASEEKLIHAALPR